MGNLDRPFELSDFSNDILSIIIEYIDDASDFLNVSMLSTRFNCLCKNEECSKPLWRKFYAKKWRMDEHELEKVSKRNNYKELYMERINQINGLADSNQDDCKLTSIIYNLHMKNQLDVQISELLSYLTDNSQSPEEKSRRYQLFCALKGESTVLYILSDISEHEVNAFRLLCIIENVVSNIIPNDSKDSFIGYIGMLFELLVSPFTIVRNMTLYVLFCLVISHQDLSIWVGLVGSPRYLIPFIFYDSYTSILCSTRLLYCCIQNPENASQLAELNVLDRINSLLMSGDEEMKVLCLGIISMYPTDEHLTAHNSIDLVLSTARQTHRTSDTVTISVLVCLEKLIRNTSVATSFLKGEGIPFLQDIMRSTNTELKRKALLIIEYLVSDSQFLERYSRVGGWDDLIYNIKNSECPIVITSIQTILMKTDPNNPGIIRSGVKLELVAKRAYSELMKLLKSERYYASSWILEIISNLIPLIPYDNKLREEFVVFSDESAYIDDEKSKLLISKILENTSSILNGKSSK